MAPTNDPIENEARLVRLETKIDFLIKAVESLPPAATVEKATEIELRVSKLETFVNRAIGVVIAANVLITLFAYKLKALIP